MREIKNIRRVRDYWAGPDARLKVREED